MLPNKIFNSFLYSKYLDFKKVFFNKSHIIVLCDLWCKLYSYLRISNYRHCFLLPILMNYFDLDIPKDAAPLINFSFSIFLINTVCILCFFNIIGYLTAIILIQKYNIENKFKSYPKFIKLIDYYKNSTFLFILIEAFICLIGLIIMEIIALSILDVTIFK